MPDKPSAIFKRLDQFNKPRRVQDNQPAQSEADVETKPALREVPAAEPEQSDQSAASIEADAIRSTIEEELSSQTTDEDFEKKAEHPPPASGQEGVSKADPHKPQESTNRPRPASVPTTRSISRKNQVDVASIAPPASYITAPLDELVRRWKEDFRVHSGEIKVLRALYGLTHGAGSDECVTTQEKLAEIAKLRRRQCINNVNSLEKMGFIERVEVYNEKGQRGIKLRFNLSPKPRSA